MEVSVTNFHQHIIDIENLFVQYISNGKPPDIFSEYIGKIYCLEDQIKNANWIDSELSKPGSLMDCIGLIISLSAILSESSSQHLSTSKTLKDQIAAAAFYQMISNLIYFMREEMLSLL